MYRYSFSISFCIFSIPEATDETLLDKLKKQHGDNHLVVPSSHAEPTFVIQHFSGRVEYHIKVGYISHTANIFILQRKY